MRPLADYRQYTLAIPLSLSKGYSRKHVESVRDDLVEINEEFIVKWLGDDLQAFVEKYRKTPDDRGGIENYK